MNAEIKYHRLGAFVYGFMTGLGLILIVWGFASIVALPSRSAAIYTGLILFGVLLFATGSCREAYLRGTLSVQPSINKKAPVTRTSHTAYSKPTKHPQTETTSQSTHQESIDENPIVEEQIRDYPVGKEAQRTDIYEEEQRTRT